MFSILGHVSITLYQASIKLGQVFITLDHVLNALYHVLIPLGHVYETFTSSCLDSMAVCSASL